MSDVISFHVDLGRRRFHCGVGLKLVLVWMVVKKRKRPHKSCRRHVGNGQDSGGWWSFETGEGGRTGGGSSF